MISVIVPTRSRPEKLERMVSSLDIECEVLIVPTFKTDVTNKVISDSRVHIVEMDQAHTVVQAFNLMAEQAKYDIVTASDDLEFMPNSLMQAKHELYDKFNGCGVVGFSTVNMQSNDDAFVIVGQSFFNIHLNKVLWHPEYLHFYGDTELGRKAKKLGLFKLSDTALIINHHPSSGERADETHNHNRTEKLAHDEQVYRRRILHGQI